MRDASVIVYRGAPLEDRSLVDVARRTGPAVTAVRHGSVGALHWVVICDSLAVAVSNAEVDEVSASLSNDAPLSSILQAAWKLTRPTAQALVERATGPERYGPLARELSRVVETCWLIRWRASTTNGQRFTAGESVGDGNERAKAIGCTTADLELVRKRARAASARPAVLLTAPGSAPVPFHHGEFDVALD